MSKILVVDDDREMGRLLKTLFELEGYEVVVASNYHEIVPAILRSQPDLVLLDLHVQGRETVELVRQMQQDERFKRLPVIMTSGMDLGEACLRAGAREFVLKPFMPTDMAELVKRLLN
jgi:CheY-like chemotaxis protein